MRFSVAMPEDLLVRFDQLVARRGLAKNRSEVVRDLVRDALVEEDCALPGTEVVGTLTIVFDHHASDLQEKLHSIQHDYFEFIVSSVHVHLDQHMCLEVIILRGETCLLYTSPRRNTVPNRSCCTAEIPRSRAAPSTAWQTSSARPPIRTKALAA